MRVDQNFALEMAYCYDKAIPHSRFLKWKPTDRAKTLAYALEHSTRCNQCGTAAWEWEQSKYAYTAVDEFCPGCYQKSMFTDQESNKTLPGTNVKLVPSTPLMKAKMQVQAKKRQLRLKQLEDE